jgi:hypothetical protein
LIRLIMTGAVGRLEAAVTAVDSRLQQGLTGLSAQLVTDMTKHDEDDDDDDDGGGGDDDDDDDVDDDDDDDVPLPRWTSPCGWSTA